MNDSNLDQSEIDALLAGVDGLSDADSGSAPSGGDSGGASSDLNMDDFGGSSDFGSDFGASSPPPVTHEDSMADDLAALLDEQPAVSSAPAPAYAAPAQAQSAPAAHAAPAHTAHMSAESAKNLEVLMDIPLQVVVELGRSEMPIQKILELGPGSIVELNRMSGEPINVLVNGKLVAKGEVVVVDENFGVKITDIISPMERLSQLN